MIETPLHIHLMTTLGCHLCEDAQALLQLYKEQSDYEFSVELVEVAESEALVEKYGIRIPVLVHSLSKQELAWPFDMEQLALFIQGST